MWADMVMEWEETRRRDDVRRGFGDVGGRFHGFLLGWGRLCGST